MVTPHSADLTHLGAAQLATLIAQGDATSVDAVEAHIAQMQRVNPKLNAMVADRFDAARAEARAADALQNSGAPLGPLHGVPFTVKECLDLTGTASTFGLQSRVNHRATADDLYVARMRAAGAIAIAKSNVSQFLMYYEADNPVYGRTNNPWNPLRTPGGSSGGEAALIAAGASPIGLGSDIGGSVRVPAAFCGVAAIKPSAGRCDDLGQFWGPRGQTAIRAQVGVLARHTADVALGLEVINGGRNPEVPGQPLFDFKTVDVRSLRVAVYTDDGTFTVAPAAARAVREAAQALRNAGALVTPWKPPQASEGLKLLIGILGADGMEIMKQRIGPGARTPQIKELMMLAAMPGWVIKLLIPILRAAGQPSMATSLGSFGSSHTARYWLLGEAQLDYQQQFARALDQDAGGPFDVILCPPCALPALTHGASKELLTAGAYGSLYNLLGYPAGVVPVTLVQESEQVGRSPSRDMVSQVALKVEQGSMGLPVAVQVVARPWREHVVLAAMNVIEKSVRQTQRFVPPMAV